MAKFHKVGNIMMKKDKSGTFITLGNPNGKKYAFEVDIRIRKPDGEVVFQGSNVIVNIQDPRKRKGITPEQAKKIPESIESDLIIVEQDEQ